MTNPIPLWTALKNFLFPRACTVCGARLSPQEEAICVPCLFDLPRTYNWLQPDNDMEQSFWGRQPITRAAAYLYYQKEAPFSQLIKAIKYRNQPEIGEVMGRIMARELATCHYFDSIDYIVPVPLARKRLRQRGYNQTEWIARGIAHLTQIPLRTDWVRRTATHDSQVGKHRIERAQNVEGVFTLAQTAYPKNPHILLVDDVFTTGATLLSCARQLAKIEGAKLTLLTLAKTR